VLTDALGNLVRFVLLPGHRYDTVGFAPLIKGLSFDALPADKAVDSVCGCPLFGKRYLRFSAGSPIGRVSGL
jgi:hypothetical protein